VDELDDVAGACRHVATSTVVEIAAVAVPSLPPPPSCSWPARPHCFSTTGTC